MRIAFSLSLAFALAFAPKILVAQSPTPNSPPSKANAAPSSAETYASEPYVFELIEKKIRFYADGKGERLSTIRVRVQSESAVRELGLLVYPFSSTFESLDVVYARVRKPDGSVVETPASDVQELDSAVSREAPMYTDEREKHIAIKSLSVGDVLEFKLRWTIHDPVAPGHFWYDDGFFREGICLKQVIEFTLPKSVPVKFSESSLKPIVREEGDFLIYTYQSSNLTKEETSKIPAWERDADGLAPPSLRFSSFPSWESVGKWFGDLQQPKLVVTPEIRAKAEELTKGKTTDEEKLRAIYDFVSLHFRYIGVDLGLGRYSPHPASDVLGNRYGDCKDKHTLFAALLQAVGISAYPALISSKYRLDPAFPSPSLFDHVITAIPRGDSFLFLDATPEVAPFGLILGGLRGRKTLVIPPNAAAHLLTTPVDPPFPQRENFHTDSTIDEKGNLDAKMRLEDRGDSEVVLRSAYRATPQNRWQELTQNLVSRMGFGGTVSNVSVDPTEDLSKPFSISFDYHRELPDWKNHRMLLPAPPFFLMELNDEQKLSKDPLPLGSLQDVTYEATVKLPKGFAFVLPENQHRTTDFAEFAAAYSLVKPDTLRGTLHLKISSSKVPSGQRSSYSDLVKATQDAYGRYIFIKSDFPFGPSPPVAFAGVAGAPWNNVASLEQALQSNPDNIMLTSLLAQAYIREGRPKEAISLVEKAVEQAPDSNDKLSFVLAHAYLELPDTEKAFELYKKALGDDPNPLALNDVAWDLAEANVHLKEALNFSIRSVSDLSSQTVDGSADDAELSDYVRMPQLAAAWDTLGWIHFRLGETVEAEKFIQSAWDLEQSANIGEHLVEILEKLGKSRKAAEICLMALSAAPDRDDQARLSQEMERLRPSLKNPSVRVESIGPMALSDMRTIRVPFHTKLRGNSRTASFIVSIANGSKAENVVFSSGAEELRGAIADLSAVHYPQSFPDETPVHIFRKGTLSCSVYVKDCTFILLPIADAAVPTR